VFRSAEEARSLAEPVDGPQVSSWVAAVSGTPSVVVAGFCEAGEGGNVYNSAAIVDRDGVLGVYRKAHLWGAEPEVFTAGAAPPPVIDTEQGRIGIAICYDLEFPELTRGLALRGAEVIAAPTNWPRTRPPSGERSMLVTLAMATARLSRIFLVVCDRTGEERGSEFEGASVVAGPDGWLRAGPPADRAAVTLFADCDLDMARDKQTGELNDAFADRRPLVYDNSLVGPAPAPATP
jgi:predicted amidohydrolase